MNSTYLKSSDKIAKRKLSSIVISLSFIFAILFGSFAGISSISKKTNTVEAFDVTQWAMCFFGKDSAPGQMYQATQSSDIQFALRSKSSITSGEDDVETGLNWILNLFGPGFEEINNNITGYNIGGFDGLSDGEEKKKPKDKFNKGSKVNPYDRFGVAGLKFSSYSGEWKHVVVDACSTEGSEPTDPKAGVYYEGRLEPRSTWEDIGKSEDIRTKQFGRGFGSQFATSFSDIVSNGVFTITKTVVVLTTALINFSFTNIVELMGMDKLLGGDGTNRNTGLFGALFAGIFMPLIVLVFAITGAQIFYKGIFKKAYRESMTDLLRSLALFVIAIIISIKPTVFISVANNVAVVTQSVILNAMNSGLAGGNGLCSTDIGTFKTKLITNSNTDEVGILKQASENMRSAVGCQYWQTFLLRPWTQGQWGTDWDQTWAKNEIADWADPDSARWLKNHNMSMVGDAAVPLGDGSFVNNWAVFQISTQTNVHSPLGHEGERPKYTSGVANDWWRIVDALSNYQEKTDTIDAEGSGAYGGSTEVSFERALTTEEAPVLSQWDTWVGNNATSRIWTAFSSVIIAIVGLAAPLIFAFLTAIYSIGVAILMAFAPIMLLIGCWAGKGWEIFKGWGELVINTTIKRIIVGTLLALSIGLTVTLIKFMETTSWWQGILLMIVVSIALIKSRKQLVDTLGSIKFASVNFAGTADKISSQTVGAIKATGRIATNGVVAGASSKRYGGTFAKGAAAGIKEELKNAAYSNNQLRNVMTEFDQVKTADGEILRGQEICAACGKKLDFEDDQYGQGVFQGGRTADGDLHCYECFVDGVDADATEVIMTREDFLDRAPAASILDKQQRELAKRNMSKRSAFSKDIEKEKLEAIKNGINKEGKVLTDFDKVNAMKNIIKTVNYDITKYKHDNSSIPEVPPEIQDSINHELLEEAWINGEYDWIRQAYTAAWVQWFVEQTGSAMEENLSEILAFVQNHANKESKKDEKEN